jgi:hypothetical protein
MHGNTAAGTEGADMMLQQQLGLILEGLYNVSVFTNDGVMLGSADLAINGSNQKTLATRLWLGDVDLDGSRGRPPGGVNVTRTPSQGQTSNDTLFLQDKLTIISKPGDHHVRRNVQLCRCACINIVVS